MVLSIDEKRFIQASGTMDTTSSGKLLNGASLRSGEELRAHINNSITDYNDNARPFVWTKRKVHQKRLANQ